MEIRQLEYFLMVSKVNSFTRAAERLYVSQPAVTNAVRALEDELGIKLFDRNQKQALLTSEGHIFYAHVEKLMHGISNTLQEINAIKNLSGGVLRLGLTPFGGIHSCVLLIKKYMESYPNIKIAVHEDSTENLQKLLVEDQIDTAIVFSGKEISALSYISLDQQELILCCERQHRFRRRNVVKIEDLKDESLIFLNDASIYKQKLEAAFNDVGVSMNVNLEANHVQTIKNFVATGCGVAILPEGLCEFDENLVTVAIDPPIYLHSMMAYKTNRHQSHATEAILNLLKNGVDSNE